MKKKIIYFLIFLILVASVIFGVILYNNQSNENNISLSLNEQQWIEQNKNDLIDIYIPSDIDVFSYLGKGVFFDYITYLQDETGLTINPISYKVDSELSKDSKYAFAITDKVAKSDVLVYEDEYVLLGHNEGILSSLDNVDNIAVLENDLELISNVLSSDINITSYETLEELIEEITKEETELDGLVLLKSQCLDEMFLNDLHINYHIKGIDKKYVLKLSGDKTLNSILEKYYLKWSKDNFEISYDNHLLSQYFNYNSITELEKNSLQEKKYIYGFVSNGAYDLIKNDKLTGINFGIIKSFAKFANIDMDYNDAYLSYDELIKDFEKGKVDLFYLNGKYNTKKDYFKTIQAIESEVVVLMNVNNPIYISDINELKNYDILTVKNSYIDVYLKKIGCKTKTYNTIDKLLANTSKDSVIAIDLENYEYYKGNSLINFKIAYQFYLEDKYGYAINSSNEIFYNLFNFYLEYFKIEDVVISSYKDIYAVGKKSNILLILVIILSLILCLEFINHLKKLVSYLKNRTKHTLSKNDKLKYIDQLTSLKNRLYLNDTIEKWDNSSIYPQSIIIVDLNDLSEINDNFGHEEGDKVILEAANILIRTQLPKTEIIRTDGSEFLIYMIEYDEKQTVAYLRKLNKELKELSHGYGAVTGYSIISDGIKTIDDAINEATLDVKTNKELLNEEQ